jgi:hypothetical protein
MDNPERVNSENITNSTDEELDEILGEFIWW